VLLKAATCTRWSAYESIAKLDPLGFDEQAVALPGVNEACDAATLTEIMSGLATDAAKALSEGMDVDNAAASLRDLDFVAGSLVRHGAATVLERDIVQSTLWRMGVVAGTVPRGTVFTYASCNPDGERRRSFTGTAGEKLFIKAVKEGVDSLDICMDGISRVTTGDSSGLQVANANMSRMVSSIVTVARGVAPEFFAYQMRPYFDGVRVDGIEYAGAGGAQMQVIAVDRMLWGADCKDEVYADYYADNVRYLTPNQRDAIIAFEDDTSGRSVVTLIKCGELPAEAAVSALGLLRTLKKFRYPHRKVANDIFALRPEGSVGSGQYTPTILDKLIAFNEAAIKALGEAPGTDPPPRGHVCRHGDPREGRILVGGEEAQHPLASTIDTFAAALRVPTILCAQATCERTLAGIISPPRAARVRHHRS
jgi:hypothetical protein